MLILASVVALLAGVLVGKKYGSVLSKAAVEAEIAKVESTATADVKALIVKIRSIL